MSRALILAARMKSFSVSPPADKKKSVLLPCVLNCVFFFLSLSITNRVRPDFDADIVPSDKVKIRVMTLLFCNSSYTLKQLQPLGEAPHLPRTVKLQISVVLGLDAPSLHLWKKIASSVFRHWMNIIRRTWHASLPCQI